MHFNANQDATARSIRQAAMSIGYAECGFASCDFFEEYENELRLRIRHYPESARVYRNLTRRADPRAGAPWAQSIVVAIRPYLTVHLPEEALGHIGRNYLADRRIPGCPDYDMPKRMTRALRDLGLKVRRGGTPDRAAAMRAGVVAIGRNGFAFSREWGSWINIETWRVDARLPVGAARPCPCPEDCNACLKTCPTGAIVAPFRMRPDRCIAYLSYEAPEPLDPCMEARMGSWIYGCDVCQEVCPLNQKAHRIEAPAPWLESIAPRLQPQALAGMDLETYQNVIQPRFWYLPGDEQGWKRWRRNATRALNHERDIPGYSEE